ncbi:hypothetical protein [Falsarthrobacter nasiphocae]|uniref:Uncharacterized protein n=1 Tax=Falsarthrobacter nasiphocae TaxID=189863 RepID=A0AAE4C6U3_9MICC|nr:hypothetical protein [Falsarthrobacter nasiphocae]MDR6891789.1 hypothetical protein [Falsarthrobacter nasiphocae]
MDYLWWIFVAVAVAGLVFMLVRRGRGAVAQGIEDSASPDFAREASAKLDADAHRQVYACIAQGRQREAVETYQKATKATLFESTVAVAALAKHPQQHQGPAAPWADGAFSSEPLGDPFTDGRLDGLEGFGKGDDDAPRGR